MIKINGKKWDELQFSDVEQHLANMENENFFFENKDDRVSNSNLVKEISAFANTFGGYIIIGVDDDCQISGCKQWNEERINNVIHDSLSPTPIVDIKTLKNNCHLLHRYRRFEYESGSRERVS